MFHLIAAVACVAAGTLFVTVFGITGITPGQDQVPHQPEDTLSALTAFDPACSLSCSNSCSELRGIVKDVLIIGNTLEETAYHEAGHIVVAARLGLDLRPKGITIWEAAKDVMDGLAGYWDHEADWDKNLQSVLAGQIAQWRKFERSDTSGSKPDNDYFFRVVKEHFPGILASHVWERMTHTANDLLQAHWSAVVEIAETVIVAEWMPVAENEHRLAKRKKRLDGEALVRILSSHGISARVR
jgi:hypothetical protein